MDGGGGGGGEDCCVKVAVHVRPLIGDEKLQGCKDCVTVVSGKPQVCMGLSRSSHILSLHWNNAVHAILREWIKGKVWLLVILVSVLDNWVLVSD